MSGVKELPAHPLRKHFWSAYCAVLLLLGYGQLLLMLYTGSGSLPERTLPPLAVTVLVGAVLFARLGKPVLNRRVWQGLFKLLMLCTALLLALLGFWLLTGIDASLYSYSQAIAALLLLLPAEHLLYRYAYRDVERWRERGLSS